MCASLRSPVEHLQVASTRTKHIRKGWTALQISKAWIKALPWSWWIQLRFGKWDRSWSCTWIFICQTTPGTYKSSVWKTC